jgi:hypothetical protein
VRERGTERASERERERRHTEREREREREREKRRGVSVVCVSVCLSVFLSLSLSLSVRVCLDNRRGDLTHAGRISVSSERERGTDGERETERRERACVVCVCLEIRRGGEKVCVGVVWVFCCVCVCACACVRVRGNDTNKDDEFRKSRLTSVCIYSFHMITCIIIHLLLTIINLSHIYVYIDVQIGAYTMHVPSIEDSSEGRGAVGVGQGGRGWAESDTSTLIRADA